MIKHFIHKAKRIVGIAIAASIIMTGTQFIPDSSLEVEAYNRNFGVEIQQCEDGDTVTRRVHASRYIMCESSFTVEVDETSGIVYGLGSNYAETGRIDWDTKAYYVLGAKEGVTKVTVPEYYNDIAVVGTVEAAFANNQDIKAFNAPHFKILPDRCFLNCENLTHVALMNVENVHDECFHNCTSLTGATFNKIKYIGRHAFATCTNLGSLDFGEPESLDLESSCFRGCTTLEKVHIPSGVKEIPEYAFTQCSKLSSVMIDEGVIKIGESAFSRTALTDLDLPDTVEDIDDYAFAKCLNLETIRFSKNLKDINYSALIGVAWLKDAMAEPISNNEPLYINDILVYGSNVYGDLVIRDGTRNIAEGAFSEWFGNLLTEESGWDFSKQAVTELISIELPDSVEIINEGAFSNLFNLESVTIGTGIQYIGVKAFYDDIKLQNIQFKGTENLEVVRSKAFGETAYFKQLKSENPQPLYFGHVLYDANCATRILNVKDGTTYITDLAFENTNVTVLRLPSSLKFIEAGAFNSSENLKTIIFKGNSCQVDLKKAVNNANIEVNTGDKIIYRPYNWEKAEENDYIRHMLFDTHTSVDLSTRAQHKLVDIGDVDEDGNITVADLVTLRKHLIGIKLSTALTDSADTNYDGTINVFDFIALKRLYINMQ